MLVRGVVEVDVPEVAARTDRMEIWFRRETELQGSVQQGQGPEGTVASEVDVRTNAGKTQSVAGQNIHQSIPAIRPPVSADRKLLATGNLIRGLVVLSPNQNELQEMSLEGEAKKSYDYLNTSMDKVILERRRRLNKEACAASSAWRSAPAVDNPEVPKKTKDKKGDGKGKDKKGKGKGKDGDAPAGPAPGGDPAKKGAGKGKGPQ